eukprot:3932886-Rhodomonas_salina.8
MLLRGCCEMCGTDIRYAATRLSTRPPPPGLSLSYRSVLPPRVVLFWTLSSALWDATLVLRAAQHSPSDSTTRHCTRTSVLVLTVYQNRSARTVHLYQDRCAGTKAGVHLHQGVVDSTPDIDAAFSLSTPISSTPS